MSANEAGSIATREGSWLSASAVDPNTKYIYKINFVKQRDDGPGGVSVGKDAGSPAGEAAAAVADGSDRVPCFSSNLNSYYKCQG